MSGAAVFSVRPLVAWPIVMGTYYADVDALVRKRKKGGNR
jgi:hypothetical protein